MTTRNNSVLFNAAIAGITAGVLSGEDYSQITSTTISSSEGAALQAEILAAAAAVDAAIPNDTAISVTVTGVLNVVPFSTGSFGNAAAITPFFTKPELLAMLCMSAFTERSLLTGETFTTIVAGIKAQYTEAVSQMQSQ